MPDLSQTGGSPELHLLTTAESGADWLMKEQVKTRSAPKK
jgi:hypothetical protein